MKKNTLNYSSVLVVLYSVYDYFEHTTRQDSIFEKHPYQWLFFTIGAIASLLIITYSLKYFLEKLLKAKNLFIEVTAVGIWLVSYIYILGPLVNKLFWPYNELLFSFNLVAFVILLSIFFIFRIIVNLVTKKKLLFSR